MDKTSRANVTEEGFYTFLKISVHLTGFGENELLATGMHETYYFTIMKEPDQDTVRAFFDTAQSILDDNAGNANQLKKEIGARLIPDSEFGGLAKKIILMWYTGIWTITTNDGPKMEMISAESYVQGLIWLAAETHPAGAKQPGYASWAQTPLS